MFYYFIYGNNVYSEVELKPLVHGSKEVETTICIRLKEMPDEIHEAIQKGKSIYVGRERLWFRNQCGDYLVEDGKNIQVFPREGREISELQPFILGYCFAMLFWQRFMPAMHCSCVRYKGNALIFSGYSGSGKSTLTTRFLDEGHGLMSDDVLMLGKEGNRVMAYPAFPQQKLCRDVVTRHEYVLEDLLHIDEGKDKYAIPRDDLFSNELAQVSAMFCLEEGDVEEVQIQELVGIQKLCAFHRNLFLQPMFEQYKLPKEDGIVYLKIMEQFPIYRLVRPRVGDSSREQMRQILLKVGD